MTEYPAANMANGRGTYRSGPQGAALKSSSSASRSMTASVSQSRTATAKTPPPPSGKSGKHK